MDVIIPVKLKSHVTALDVQDIKDKGIAVRQLGNELFAVCHDDLDIKTVRHVNDVMDNYYYSEGA